MEISTNYGSCLDNVLGVGDRSNRECLDDVFILGLHWRAIPVCGREQIASERTFVCFFSTKHGSLRITVGLWHLRKLQFDPPPSQEASISSRSQGEVHHDTEVAPTIIPKNHQLKNELLAFFSSGKFWSNWSAAK
ncbi:hypothetical protein CFP56_039175, partial [Quercus suber]